MAWYQDPDDAPDFEIVHILNDAVPDDEVCVLYGEPEENRKRAALIIAAPDLLAALRDAVKGCACTIRERESGHRVECFAPAALDAITKAENLPEKSIL
jgi:hypothetical protein